MTPEHYVSVSSRRVRGKTSYRVALKYFGGDMNTLDRTLFEEVFRSKSAADNRASDLSRRFAARII